MLSKQQVIENPKLINTYIQDHISDFDGSNETNISTLVKHEFKKNLHPSTLNKYIDDKWKNQSAVNKAKKAKHKTSLKRKILNIVKDAGPNELTNIAKGLNETYKLFDK